MSELWNYIVPLSGPLIGALAFIHTVMNSRKAAQKTELEKAERRLLEVSRRFDECQANCEKFEKRAEDELWARKSFEARVFPILQDYAERNRLQQS